MYDFTKDEYEMIIDKCMFNDELKLILEMKIKGYSRVEIMMKLRDHNIYLSERTLDRRIEKIKKKILKVI